MEGGSAFDATEQQTNCNVIELNTQCSAPNWQALPSAPFAPDVTDLDLKAAALDSNDHVHVLLQAGWASGVHTWYGTNASGAWVDTYIGLGRGQDLALGPNDDVHILYAAGAALRYASNQGGAWQSTAITATLNTGWPAKVEVSSDGTAHFAVVDTQHDTNVSLGSRSDDCLKIWTERIDCPGSSLSWQQLGVDANDDLHVGMVGTSNMGDQLRYATNTGGGWSVEHVGAILDLWWLDNDITHLSDMAVGDDGVVHMCYLFQDGEQFPTNVVYRITNASGSWTDDAVNVYVVDEGCSITLDDAGGVHLATTLWWDDPNAPAIYYSWEGPNAMLRKRIWPLAHNEAEILVRSDGAVQVFDMLEEYGHHDLWENEGPQNLRVLERECNAGVTSWSEQELAAYFVPECDPLSPLCDCLFYDNFTAPVVRCGNHLALSALDEACGSTVECEANQYCADANAQQWCQSASCCTTYCDLLGPNTCGQGLTCQPLWQSVVPFGLDDVGVCAD